jgi:hypothetical protein
MASEDNASASQVLGGAFGGEAKYLFISLFGSAGVLFGSFIIVAELLGDTLSAMRIALGIGGVLGFVTFIGSWLVIYYIKWSYSSSKKSYKLWVRPQNYEWPTLVADDKKAYEQLNDGEPTGWRTKQFYLAKPTEYNDGQEHNLGLVSEFDVQYYGEWKNLSDGQPGYAEYDDLVLPNNFTECLDVEFITINIKHGEKIPVFRLIAARKTGRYIDYSKLIANPSGLALATQQTGLAVPGATTQQITDLKEENETLRAQLIESQRQSREDKAYAYKNEQVISLVSGEVDSFKDIGGEMQDIIVDDLQAIVALNHDFDKALAWFKRGESRWHTLMPIMIAFAAFCILIAFFASPVGKGAGAALNTDLNNPLLDFAIILGVAAVFAFIIFRLRRNRE